MTSAYLDKTDAFMASLDLETYRVGGSVRDELLGRRAKDADYMVRGVSLAALGLLLAPYKPSPLKFRDGRQNGWRVAQPGLGAMEIVLPRTDVSTGPGHRDFEIICDPDLSLQEDAMRRDFTFNALYKPVGHEGGDNPRVMLAELGGVCDPTGRGLYDLSRKLISTTYAHSFRDDPLRTLRALRLVSTLGYDLSSATYNQMGDFAEDVDGLSASGNVSGTVLDELIRLLMGSQPEKALRIARDTGVLANLLPELAPMLGFQQESKYHDLTTCEHTFRALVTAVHSDAPLRVRMALLFHDSGKPESAWRDENGRLHFYACPDGSDFTEDHEVISERLWRAACVRLNVPRELREEVATLIRNHMVPLEGKFKPSKVRRARVKFGDDMLRDLYLHRACDIAGKEARVNWQHWTRIRAMEDARAEAQADKVPTTAKALWIGGDDAKALGLNGRQVGEALSCVLDDVVVQPSVLSMSDPWQRERLAMHAERILGG